jgi:hypothetical protein
MAIRRTAVKNSTCKKVSIKEISYMQSVPSHIYIATEPRALSASMVGLAQPGQHALLCLNSWQCLLRQYTTFI